MTEQLNFIVDYSNNILLIQNKSEEDIILASVNLTLTNKLNKYISTYSGIINSFNRPLYSLINYDNSYNVEFNEQYLKAHQQILIRNVFTFDNYLDYPIYNDFGKNLDIYLHNSHNLLKHINNINLKHGGFQTGSSAAVVSDQNIYSHPLGHNFYNGCTRTFCLG